MRGASGVSQGLPGAARLPAGPVLGRVHGAAPWEEPEAAAGAARQGWVTAAGRRHCGAAAAGRARTAQPSPALVPPTGGWAQRGQRIGHGQRRPRGGGGGGGGGTSPEEAGRPAPERPGEEAAGDASADPERPTGAGGPAER